MIQVKTRIYGPVFIAVYFMLFIYIDTRERLNSYTN